MATRALRNEPESSANEQSREYANDELYFLIQVVCNMTAKDQVWNENIWTVTRATEKNQS